MKNLTETEFIPYFKYYIDLNPENDLISGLKNSHLKTVQFFESLPLDKLNYQYEVGKWTPKDILQHIIDTERIFAFRALTFARFDKVQLPGFEENDYAANVNTETKELSSLLQEYKNQRVATISMFESFNDEMLKSIGNSNGNYNSVRAIGFLIPGHEIHHINIIKERYL
jgi:uncharacterized damage-inducible protein DinB